MIYKRLFFAFEISSPWPEEMPEGRYVPESSRHLTMAFLGKTAFTAIEEVLEKIPKPALKVGLTGHFDGCLFLPVRHPNVVAWHISWWEDNTELIIFRSKLIKYLHEQGLMEEENRPLLPHVTVCRAPFTSSHWQKTFKPLPLYLGSLHLYESVGNLHYEPIWTHALATPFEEVAHTADIAFLVRGENLRQLYKHAFMALCFRQPTFMDYYHDVNEINSIEEIVNGLNISICKADAAVGCPFKAVSFHGDIIEVNGLLTWEMIVDV